MRVPAVLMSLALLVGCDDEVERPIDSVVVDAGWQRPVGLDAGSDGEAPDRVAAEQPGPEAVVPCHAYSGFAVTGSRPAVYEPLRQAIVQFMRERGIRAGVVGIALGNTILTVNGYGYTDGGLLDANPWDNDEGCSSPSPLVVPTTPFRVASVTKVLTAAAVRDALEDSPSTTVFSYALDPIEDALGFQLSPGPHPYNPSFPPKLDPHWTSMTVLQLMTHTSGLHGTNESAIPTTSQPRWDQSKLPYTTWQDAVYSAYGFETGHGALITKSFYILDSLREHQRLRVDPSTMIEFLAGVDLRAHPPGQYNIRYSNVGYVVLGRVLEGLRATAPAASVPDGFLPAMGHIIDYIRSQPGVVAGDVFASDGFHDAAAEPYYRDLDGNPFIGASERRFWNAADADRILYDGSWKFCVGSCPYFSQYVRTGKAAYGAMWYGTTDAATSLVMTARALLKMMATHIFTDASPYDTTSIAQSVLPGYAGCGGNPGPCLPHVGDRYVGQVPLRVTGDAHRPVFGSVAGVLSMAWHLRDVDSAFVNNGQITDCNPDIEGNYHVVALFNQRRGPDGYDPGNYIHALRNAVACAVDEIEGEPQGPGPQ